MQKFSGFVLSVLCLLLCAASTVGAVEIVPLSSQVPARTSSGATNLTDVWLHHGGSRLYWNTLVTPRQVALEGAQFVDPAAVPDLMAALPSAKKITARRPGYKNSTAKNTRQGLNVLPPNIGTKGLKKTNSSSYGKLIPPAGAKGLPKNP